MHVIHQQQRDLWLNLLVSVNNEPVAYIGVWLWLLFIGTECRFWIVGKVLLCVVPVRYERHAWCLDSMLVPSNVL